MLRLFAAFVALSSLFATTAEAQKYTDPQGRFSVTVPEGWQADKPNIQGGVQNAEIALLMAGARDGKLIGLCLGILASAPETKSLTQAEINEALSQEMTDEAWRAALKSAGAGEEITLESSGARDADGRRVFYAVVKMKMKAAGGKVDTMKGKQELHAIPGAVHSMLCMTNETDYETASADFETIFTSYTPMRGVIAAAPQPVGPSVLTLYAGSSFAGVARVLAQDTPNVAALGLSGPVASLAVAGFGQWEACEGANFTGKCRVLSMAETADAGQSLHIGSLRRHNAGGAKGLTGLINATTGRALRTAVERFASH